MSRRVLPLYSLLFITLVGFSACSSTQDKVSPEWTESMFFKNAQEAMDEDRFDVALYYYEVYLVRYPENHQRAIAAEYERAFIHYKKRDYNRAEDGFREVIRKYDESPYAMLYHPRFRQLAEMGLVSIEKKKTVERKLFWRMRERDWAEEHGESLLDESGSSS